MSDGEGSERQTELVEKIGALLTEYADMAGDDMELPVVADWAITVAWDDAGDGRRGRGWTGWPRGQWRHRTAGLLQMALDDVREINREVDD